MALSSDTTYDETLRQLTLRLNGTEGEKWKELLDQILKSRNPVSAMEEFLDRAGPEKLLQVSRATELPAIGPLTVTEESFRAIFQGPIHDNFLKNFLGKIEPGVPAQKLAARSIQRMATDVPIIDELG